MASARLTDDDAQQTARRIRQGTPVHDGSGRSAPFGPVVRYLVLGGDGVTRTLQTEVNVDPQDVTDGHRTVEVEPLADGDYAPLPTPFSWGRPVATGTTDPSRTVEPSKTTDAPLHPARQACT